MKLVAGQRVWSSDELPLPVAKTYCDVVLPDHPYLNNKERARYYRLKKSKKWKDRFIVDLLREVESLRRSAHCHSSN